MKNINGIKREENEFPICWQWAGPSEHICYQAGFRENFTMEAGFATGPEIKD